MLRKCILILIFFNYSISYCQHILERKASLCLNNVSLNECFKSLEKKHKINITFNSCIIPKDTIISIDYKNESLNTVLTILLSKFYLDFKCYEDYIIIYKPKRKPVNTIETLPVSNQILLRIKDTKITISKNLTLDKTALPTTYTKEYDTISRTLFFLDNIDTVDIDQVINFNDLLVGQDSNIVLITAKQIYSVNDLFNKTGIDDSYYQKSYGFLNDFFVFTMNPLKIDSLQLISRNFIKYGYKNNGVKTSNIKSNNIDLNIYFRENREAYINLFGRKSVIELNSSDDCEYYIDYSGSTVFHYEDKSNEGIYLTNQIGFKEDYEIQDDLLINNYHNTYNYSFADLPINENILRTELIRNNYNYYYTYKISIIVIIN